MYQNLLNNYNIYIYIYIFFFFLLFHKGKKYDIQYTYLEEPTFSKFKINIYNQTNSVTIDEIKTDDFSKMDIHTITLEYPKVQTGKYKIVGLDDKNNAISNDFSVKLVLKGNFIIYI